MSRAPTCRHPHDVPDLRLFLLDQWHPGGPFAQIAQAGHWAWTLPEQHRDGSTEATWERRTLAQARLWWVSVAMIEEISHVAGELPPDVRPRDIPGLITDDGVVPSLVVLEKTVAGRDAANGADLSVDALLFGGTLWASGGESIATVAYRRHDFENGLPGKELPIAAAILARLRGEQYPMGPSAVLGCEWWPLGRSDWPVNHRVVERANPRVSDTQQVSHIEDRRWLAAFHLVVADHRVATVRQEQSGEKAARRRSERKGLDPKVRVIYLRALANMEEDEEQGDGPKRKGPRAHIVRSHPRWQAWGPGHADRRLIMVPRHSRGHGENPKEGPPTVRAVVR